MPNEYFDLGDYHRAVTTTSQEAQTWFDRGLTWMYAFNHEEAVKCFQRAIDEDEDCCMAHWGVAYAVGPNYNKGWDAYDPIDLEESLRIACLARDSAKKGARSATPVEQAIIAALDQRYGSGLPEDASNAWNEDFARAMRRVHNEHPDDLDVLATYADAMINCSPWRLWDLPGGRPAAGTHTGEAMEVLEQSLDREEVRTHPGILHMYIHLMEMSPFPERALWVGEWLRDLVPDGGHLHHMPTHLDVLCGDYRRVIVTNSRACEADQRYVDRAGMNNFYTLYRLHNLHFKIYGAMFLGHRRIALETSEELVRALPDELLRVRVPPMADWLEGFLSIGLHARIRFGLWDEIVRLPLPQDQELYCSTTAMMHYAKGVAHAARGRIAEAEQERELFKAAQARVPASRTLFNNTVVDILGIASAMLEGELEYRKGNFDRAFAGLRRSIELDDNLPYDEPWGWMQPTRHAYGALLLEQGHVAEAAAVYRADLGLDDTLPRASQHPNNVWSLHGYRECLHKLGRQDEAGIIDHLLTIQAAQADIQIEASCACRLEPHVQRACCPAETNEDGGEPPLGVVSTH